MTWFKVDDKLPHHHKARAVRRSHSSKARDCAPFGLWVIAGALSDDGFIPTEVLEEWDDHAHVLAGRLVAAGLWWPSSKDGEPGYWFNDWHDMNPVSTGAMGNHVRWHASKGKTADDCQFCFPNDPGIIRGSSGEDPSDIPPISDPTSGGIVPVPTRPDPTRPVPKNTRLAASASMDGFEDFWEAYPRKTAKANARKAWKGAIKKASIQTILDGLERMKPQWTEPRYIPYPATWLNAERWADEPPAGPVTMWDRPIPEMTDE